MQIDGFDQLQLPTPPSGDEARFDALRRAAGKGDTEETAKQFETLFATLLVRELRRSMPQGIFGDGPGADVYEGWFDEHLGNALAQRDSLGLAGMIKTSIHRAQAAAETDEADAPHLSGPPAPPFLADEPEAHP